MLNDLSVGSRVLNHVLETMLQVETLWLKWICSFEVALALNFEEKVCEVWGHRFLPKR